MHCDWTHHLLAASGYLDLGMITEASDEIEEIAPEDKTQFDVLAFKIDLFRAAKSWDGMEAIARHLMKLQPNEPRWILDVAWAVRRMTGLADAKAILEDAESRFPEDALFQYNLGCYACVTGDLEAAKKRLHRSFELDPDLKLTAIDDPDLEAIFGAEKIDG